jgi:hypothetical protein
MSARSRRRFLGVLGAAPLGLAACKVEPILDLPPPPDPERQLFAEPPPRIPDQLEDAEALLDASLATFLAREQPYLSGQLRERLPEQTRASEHLVALLQVHGLEPAGPRGGWLQDVELRLAEQPPEHAPVVVVRREGELGEALELAPHGAFRQRRAGDVESLLLTHVRSLGEPLPRESIAGRIVPLRIDDAALRASELLEQLDASAALVRQGGAAGLLLLCAAPPDVIDELRVHLRRQFRLAESSEADELVLEGVLSASGSELVSAALADADASWLLDARLGVRERSVTSHNVIARLVGRELPGEAVVLVCAWDTRPGHESRHETLRLLTSLATFVELAEWLRRGTRPRRSLLLVFAVDAGLGAGQLAHARWSASNGVQPRAVLGLDLVEPDRIPPALLLSGHFDARTSESTARAARREARELLLANELTLPSLAPYLRAPIPVVTIGAAPDAGAGEREQINAGIHAEVRLLRSLLLALADHA